MDAKQTGGRIAALRKARGMTQQQLANRLCLTNKAVSKWETGEGLPDVASLPPLAAALGVSIDELLCGKAEVERTGAYPKGARLAMAMQCALCALLVGVIAAQGKGIVSFLEPASVVFVLGLAPVMTLLAMRVRRSEKFLENLVCFGALAAGCVCAAWNAAMNGLSGYPWSVYNTVVFLPILYAVLVGLMAFAVLRLNSAWGKA